MAGRLQLESIGKQDKYFTDDPEFSFFSQMHKKHTLFSRQSIKLEGNKPIDFNEVIRFTIPQDQGDLLSKVSFEFEVDPIVLFNHGFVDSLGHAIIDYCDLYIGGVLIERVTTDYLQIYSEQSVTQTKQYGLSKTLAKTLVKNSTDEYLTKYSVINFNKPKKFVVNIPFHFYKKPELALPICALKKQEVEVEIKTRRLDDLILTRSFQKFAKFPTIPYQQTYDYNLQRNIMDIQFIPDLDNNEYDGTKIGGIGILGYHVRLTNRLYAYILALDGDNLKFYNINADAYVKENKDLIEIEAVSFWRFQTNFLFKQTDPSVSLDRRITSGRTSKKTGTQFFADGTSTATVPKYNTFVVGDEDTGNVYMYVNKDEVSRITTAVGYGTSIAISDDSETILVGARDSTIKVLSFEDIENPTEVKTLDCGDPTAELRQVKISGDGRFAFASDVINLRLYIIRIDTGRTFTIDGLESDIRYGVSANGRRVIVGLTTASAVKVYDFDGDIYALSHTIAVPKIYDTKVCVAISRNGESIFYNVDYHVKTDSLKPFEQVEIKNFRMVTDFILLDKIEKNIVSNSCRDFAFTQVQQAENQLIPLFDTNYTFRTNFVNVVKELYFVFQCLRFNNEMILPACNYDNIGIEVDYQSNVCFYEHMYDMQMILDNETVLNEDSGGTFFLKSIQSGLHHKRTPMSRRFYSYSFATEPEKSLPTGQRNFSVINNQMFKVNLVPQGLYRRELRVYGLTYNILRLVDGAMYMVFPYRSMPVPTTPNNSVGPNDRIPVLFANAEGYAVPCVCPEISNCPEPEDVPGSGYPMH